MQSNKVNGNMIIHFNNYLKCVRDEYLSKGIDGYKSKTPIYAVNKRSTSHLEHIQTKSEG